MRRVIFALSGTSVERLGSWLTTNLKEFSKTCSRAEERWVETVTGSDPPSEERLAEALWDALTTSELNPTIDVERHAIFLGCATDPVTQACFATAAQTLRHRHFLEIPPWTLKLAGVLLWPQNASVHSSAGLKNLLAQLITQKQEVGALRTWDFLAIVRDSNQRQGFEEGYPRLEDPTAILGVCGLHLALHAEDLRWPALPDSERSPLWSMGAAGLFFDAVSLRKNHAQNLAARTLAGATGACGAPHGADARVKELLSVAQGEAAAKAMVEDSQRPKLFFPGPFGAKHHASFSPISPWRFWSAKLLEVYFGLFLRRLPMRLREFCHLYLLRLKARLSEFAEQWCAKRSQLFRGKLEETLEGLLVNRSLRAVSGFLEDVAQGLEEERNAGFEVGADLLDTEPWLKIHLSAEPRPLNATEENRLLAKLAEVIARHPLPGTLFLLGYFGAVMLFLTLPWALAWRLAAGAAVFLLGLAWYWLILRERMQAIRKYLVAVVDHARWQLAETVRNAVVRFQGEALQFVREVQQRLAELRLEPQAVESARFQASELFQEARGTIRVPGGISLELALLPAVATEEDFFALVEHPSEGRQPANLEILVSEVERWLSENPQARELLRGFLLTGDSRAKDRFCQALSEFWEQRVTFLPQADTWLASALEAGAHGNPSLAKLLVFCATRAQAYGAASQHIRWQVKGPWDQAVQESLTEAIQAIQALQGSSPPDAVEITGSPVFTLANIAPLSDGELWPQGTTLQESEVTPATAKVAGRTKATSHDLPVLPRALSETRIEWFELRCEEALEARRQRDALDQFIATSRGSDAIPMDGRQVEF